MRRSLVLHRPLASVPVLVRAGSVLPLQAASDVGNDVGIPTALDLVVVPGADGEFTLVEDDEQGGVARTVLSWDQSSATLVVEPAVGDDVVRDQRDLAVVLLGFATIDAVTVHVGPDEVAVEVAPADDRGARRVALGAVPTDQRAVVVVDGDPTPTTTGIPERVFEVLDRARIDREVKNRVLARVRAAASPADAVAQLPAMDLPRALSDALSELLLAR